MQGFQMGTAPFQTDRLNETPPMGNTDPTATTEQAPIRGRGIRRLVVTEWSALAQLTSLAL